MELRFTRFTQIKYTAKQTRSMIISTKCMAFAQKARALMAQHGLHYWSFVYNKRKRHLGVCFYRDKRIELSVYLVDHNSDEQCMDTLLHEIAHAIAGYSTGHGYAWKKVCVKIGAKPERCCNDTSLHMPESNHHTMYVAHCPSCSGRHVRHRMSTKRGRFYFCKQCGPTVGRLTFRLSS
jgi:predicted SprT family Zn-dependent metalloprotease